MQTIATIKAKCVVDENGCWNWSKASAGSGYGRIKHGGKLHSPHRLAYALANGTDGMEGMDVCHTCDNRKCCNPAHLFIGTRSENMLDCSRKGRHVHLQVPPKHGPENIEIVKALLASGLSMRAASKTLGWSKDSMRSFVKRHGLLVG